MFGRVRRQRPAVVERDVVSEMRQAAQRADQLSEVNTARLSDFRYNPAAVEHRQSHLARVHRRQVELEAARELARAEDEHGRLVAELARSRRWQSAQDARDERAISHAVRAADDAGERFAAIQQARREHSAAEAAGALTRSRRWWTRGYLGFAVAASGVSMVGLAHLFMARGGGVVGAYATAALVETVLTVLVTYIIAAQAHLSQRDGLARDADSTRIAARVPRWAARLPWSVVAGLLAVSVLLNGAGVLAGTGVYGVVGMAGAVAAAMCSALAWAHSVATTAVTMAALDDHDIQAGEDELARRASGVDIPTSPQDRPQETPVEVPVAPDEEEQGELEAREVSRAAMDAATEDPALRDLMFSAITRDLGDDGDEGDDGAGGSGSPDPLPSGPLGGQERHPVARTESRVGGAHLVAQEVPTDAHPAQGPVPEATPEAVRAYARSYPDQSKSAIAKRFQVSRRSVSRYLDGGAS